MASRQWRRPLRKTLYGRAAAHDDGPTGQPIVYTLDGELATPAQTELGLSHGGVPTTDVAMPVAVAMTSDSVAVSWTSDSTMAPGDTWTLTLQKRTSGAPAFEDVATFDFFVD